MSTGLQRKQGKEGTMHWFKRKHHCHMSETHPIAGSVPSSGVWKGSTILASKDGEIIGWTPNAWTHGPGP